MYALLIVGLILSAVGGIWLLVVAFQESVWWGLGCLFIGPVAIVFTIMHWQVAKKPFVVSVAGAVLLIFAAIKMPGLVQPAMST